jgi:hypothetical protein
MAAYEATVLYDMEIWSRYVGEGKIQPQLCLVV